MMMNFMSNGAPKLIRTSTRAPRSMYALNMMSNGAPKLMSERTMRCPIGQAMGRKRRCVQKKCPAGKMLNPLTGRCINKPVAKRCPAGKMINPLTGRCINKPVATGLKKCPAGKMINPLTGRCINKPVAKGPKKCPAGKMLSAKGRCVYGPGSRKTYALNMMVNGRPVRM